jgi:GNAT superfamily N-acetyltransferase
VRIRPFRPDDYDALAALWNQVDPGSDLSVEALRAEDRIFFDTAQGARRYVLEVPDLPVPVAAGGFRRNVASADPGSFWLYLAVRRDYRGRGLGSALYDYLVDALRECGASRVRVSAREDATETLAFLRRRGYIERSRLWESEAVPSDLDFEAYRPLLRSLAERGIAIDTIAAHTTRRPEAWDELYRLHVETGADSPRLDPYEPVPPEVWSRSTRDNPHFLADGAFVAKSGDRLVGISYGTRNPGNPARMHQWYTGVLRPFRGQGIATALKVRVLEFARNHGYSVVRTFNDSRNGPMLAVNEKLGFRRRVGWIGLERTLGDPRKNDGKAPESP